MHTATTTPLRRTPLLALGTAAACAVVCCMPAAAAAQPARPTIRASFVATVWSLQNSSDSLFVNQTLRVAVDDGLGAVSQNQSIPDGRLAARRQPPPRAPPA